MGVAALDKAVSMGAAVSSFDSSGNDGVDLAFRCSKHCLLVAGDSGGLPLRFPITTMVITARKLLNPPEKRASEF